MVAAILSMVLSVTPPITSAAAATAKTSLPRVTTSGPGRRSHQKFALLSPILLKIAQAGWAFAGRMMVPNGPTIEQLYHLTILDHRVWLFVFTHKAGDRVDLARLLDRAYDTLEKTIRMDRT
jgi:hypothetical protein